MENKDFIKSKLNKSELNTLKKYINTRVWATDHYKYSENCLEYTAIKLLMEICPVNTSFDGVCQSILKI